MRKKAMIMYYIIITGFLVGLAVFYVNSMFNKLEGQTGYIGELQLKYLEASQQLEHNLFYLDQAAKYSIYKALFDLGDKGGFYAEPECSTYNKYVLWQSLDNNQIKSCFPKNVQDEFTLFLKENLNKYSQIYTSESEETKLYKDNYDFLVEGNLKVTGFATLPLYKPIYYSPKGAQIEARIGEYSIKPSFVQEVDYDLNSYNNIKDKAVDINKECANALDLRACVRKEATNKDWGVNYCPIFPEEEKECLDRNENLAPGAIPWVSWFDEEWFGLWGEYKFENCVPCPSTATCSNYVIENYCTLDPCNLNCIWKDNRCQELTQADLDERRFGFCVVQDKEFPYYDGEEITKKPVTIKFAMYIKDPPPPPIKGLSVSDNKNAEQSIILRWEKSKDEDIKKYMIYYSEDDFKDKTIETIRADSNIIKKEIDYNEDSLIKFDSINIDNCELKRADNKIICEFDGNKLDVNTLYYIEETDELFYILYNKDIKEKTNYYFGVTAVDKSDNEIDNKEEKLNIVRGKSEDDLAPGLIKNFTITLDNTKEKLIFSWEEVKDNMITIEDSLDDLEIYQLFYQGCTEPTNFPLNKDEPVPADNTQITTSASRFKCGIQTIYNYYFFVLAKDKNNNPSLSFDKLKELGLIIKGVPITDNNDGTFEIGEPYKIE